MMWNAIRDLKFSLSRYGHLHRKMEGCMFKLSEYKRLAALKDIHKGERCFIVGNGPSLRQHDLYRLIGERIFVTNMFVLNEMAIKLRPSYYCISDWIHWSKAGEFTRSLLQGFRNLKDTAFIFEYDARRVVNKTPELKGRRVYYLFQEDDAETVWDGHFTTDVREPLYWGRTVTIDACIPFACYMGFKDIYLIGNDYNWNIEKSSMLHDAYFYDITRDDRELAASMPHKDTGSPEHIALVMKAFNIVRERLRDSGHTIYNAGYGGRLETFPRVNCNDLF